MTNFARDEFDRVPEVSSRQGVHRAASAPSRPKLWPILSVGIAALAVGLVAFLLLPQLGFQPALTPPPAAAADTSAASASPTATPSASRTPSATPSASASASEPASPSALEPAASETIAPAAVDKSQPVAIFNGTLTSGLAGRVGATVKSDGWVLGEVANWQGAPQQQSVIFYSDAAHRANAEALSELLNIPTLVESADFPTPVAVVLGPGYQ
ncbi:LytR C-terminal domain-containing protein [Arthrobacter sp. FW305-BF8]|uniref:LytR C-terminal domain-containing protein n=1 Tax=Arthrobacter sp. FW305-BF8 TaxID=2879617 RepID=UPI001F217A37|nr:LytR C-terminal domain-containing protein [Arthrobacter sp. FW305-BF8]UKA55297.1 LytR C-terminal domain-containing protein [Arthrobacter sp. FW305-BF8]